MIVGVSLNIFVADGTADIGSVSSLTANFFAQPVPAKSALTAGRCPAIIAVVACSGCGRRRRRRIEFDKDQVANNDDRTDHNRQQKKYESQFPHATANGSSFGIVALLAITGTVHSGVLGIRRLNHVHWYVCSGASSGGSWVVVLWWRTISPLRRRHRSPVDDSFVVGLLLVAGVAIILGVHVGRDGGAIKGVVIHHVFHVATPHGLVQIVQHVHHSGRALRKQAALLYRSRYRFLATVTQIILQIHIVVPRFLITVVVGVILVTRVAHPRSKVSSSLHRN